MEDRPDEAPVPPPPSEPPAPPPPLPWEDPSRPWLGAFFATIALVYQQPRQAFERMAVTGDPLRPLIFPVLIQWPLFIVAGLFAIMTRGSFGTSLPAGNPILHYEEMYIRLVPVLIALAPLWILVGILFGSAIRHLFLMLVGGAKSGFQATLRTVCYANAGALLIVIPCLGGVLGAVAMIAFEIIGLSAAHRITKTRAAMAFVLPALFCCVCFTFLFTILRLTGSQYGSP